MDNRFDMPGSPLAPADNRHAAVEVEPMSASVTSNRDSLAFVDSSDDDSSSALSDEDVLKPSKRERIKSLGQKTKRKTKKLLHIDDTAERIGEEQDGIIQDLEASPAFNPQKIFSPEPITVGGKIDKTLGKVQKIALAVVHPRDSIKNKVATKLAGKEQPFVSREADTALLRAHEELNQAVSESSANSGDEEHIDKLKDRVDEIEDNRDSMKVAWTTSRYVHRVRVVPRFDYPRPEDFEELDENGNTLFHWDQWLGQRLVWANQNWVNRYIDDFDQSPFDREVMIQHIERIIMASAPWQEWFSRLRQIYRWEDPWKTSKWFAFFMFLWLINHVISFFWLYIVFIVVRHRLQPKSGEALRDAYERTIDRGASVFKFSELVQRHGRGKWLDPMIDQAGPYVQLQLADLADYMEILTNFYEWKDPVKTTHTLFYWMCCITIGVIAPTDFSLRIVTFISIVIFFMARPIASNYPKYRHIVSPIMWMFWDIPTNAGWSFRYLRLNAQETREQIIARKVEETYTSKSGESFVSADQGDVPVPVIRDEYVDAVDVKDSESLRSDAIALDDIDVLSFRCKWRGTLGYLVLSTNGLRFVRSIPGKDVWRRSYQELDEMCKINGTKFARLKSEHILEFQFTDGTAEQIEAMKQRDKAFNSIIGFSGLQWQMLQPGPGRFGNGTESKNEGGATKRVMSLNKH